MHFLFCCIYFWHALTTFGHVFVSFDISHQIYYPSFFAGWFFFLRLRHTIHVPCPRYWLALWVGRRCRVELLDTLFGVDRPEDVTALAPLSPFNAPALELVEAIQKAPNGIGSPPLVIIRQGLPPCPPSQTSGSGLERAALHSLQTFFLATCSRVLVLTNY